MGRGAFGVVVRAVWRGGGASGHLVAVKVTTRSMAMNGGRDYDSEIAKAKSEVTYALPS